MSWTHPESYGVSRISDALVIQLPGSSRLTTASSAAAFDTNVTACQGKFGIKPAMVSFGLPLSMVIHKPMRGAYYILLVFFLAKSYNVSCTPAWIVLAVFIAIVISVATPPVPGGGSIAYSLLLTELGIPIEALGLALTLDLMIDFLTTSGNLFASQMALINIATQLGLIDDEVLHAL